MFDRLRRRNALPMVIAALLAAGLAACDSGSPMESDMMTLADLAGTWEVTSFSYTSNDNPAMAFGLIQAGGVSTLSIQPQGNFTGTILLPDAITGQGDMTLPISGIMRLVDVACIRIDFVPEIPPFFMAMETDFELRGNTLTIINTTSDFDFDQDGVPEPATLQVTAERR